MLVFGVNTKIGEKIINKPRLCGVDYTHSQLVVGWYRNNMCTMSKRVFGCMFICLLLHSRKNILLTFFKRPSYFNNLLQLNCVSANKKLCSPWAWNKYETGTETLAFSRVTLDVKLWLAKMLPKFIPVKRMRRRWI